MPGCFNVQTRRYSNGRVFVDCSGADQAAMRRVRFSALLAVGSRAAFAEALETLFRTGAPARIASELVTREGDVLPVTLALAERPSAYASNGAVVVVTRRHTKVLCLRPMKKVSRVFQRRRCEGPVRVLS